MSRKKNYDPSIETLKIIQSRIHEGPKSPHAGNPSSNGSKFSTAVNKIRVDNNLKISMKSDPNRTDKDPDRQAKAESKLIPIYPNPDTGNAAEDAIAYFAGFDRWTGGKPGTDKYVEKANQFEKAKVDAYAKLGISYTPGDKRPELTQAQREVYNQTVYPASFNYWRVQMSYHQPGKSLVRTTEFCALSKLDLDKVLSLIEKGAVKFEQTHDVSVKG